MITAAAARLAGCDCGTAKDDAAGDEALPPPEQPAINASKADPLREQPGIRLIRTKGPSFIKSQGDSGIMR